MGYRISGRSWPTITVYHRCDGDRLLAASLFRHTEWDVTKVKLPRSVDGLESVLKALRAGKGFRVDVPDPPYTPGQLVLKRNRNRGVVVEGSRSPGASNHIIDLVVGALSRHEKVAEQKSLEAARARQAQRGQRAESARENPRRVDDRDRSVSLRTVSGGLPTLGRRSR
ncbi:hypothetical protein ACIRPT_40390 [Streptomyces sp. NPDC101227]|uniref:hypothetical protein n=1 Tax=Streptomyces sp. NPDC101227 TaxID=3366136 RepID=UPI0037F4E06D